MGILPIVLVLAVSAYHSDSSLVSRHWCRGRERLVLESGLGSRSQTAGLGAFLSRCELASGRYGEEHGHSRGDPCWCHKDLIKRFFCPVQATALDIRPPGETPRRYITCYFENETTDHRHLLVPIAPIYDKSSDTVYSKEELLKLCEETSSMGRKFGINDVSSFAGSNCALIRLYYPEVTCEQINVFMQYCHSTTSVQ
ncbi:unnamed protein product [Heligmosomoides polygyrus]|uniref:Thyroglobulin type-1 domain-containing protein n=1 Tax=Heligmosomoides polygyrus TaxID=6339 RepID=A0A183GWC6_HELPZ|nr:unnamed protein product [Heligmosomoides polygyrus]